ncbi:MAG: ABC transporter permease [Gammaproteobacteria bacterium]|nr:ABC transporter permease [Gammaproteobacteria bacterium]
MAQILAVAEAEVRKLIHDPLELITRAIQPVLWLGVFGQVMGKLRGIPAGNLSYEDFLAPGILAQSVTFIAIFYGIAAIWERDSGVLTKYLVSPAPRWTLVLGKAMGSGVRSLTQAVIVFVLAMLLGVHVRLEIASMAGLAAFCLLGAAIFSTFSLIIACIVQTRERFMGIGQLLTMPLFFASNAIYPLQLMPEWLRLIARANPLTYLVDAMRALMCVGAGSSYGLSTDFTILALVLLVLTGVAARIYPAILR